MSEGSDPTLAMRQFFTVDPYIPPPDPEPVIALMRQHGTRRTVKRGEVIKTETETNRLFLVEEGVCAYYCVDAPHPFIPFLMLPGCTLGDITTLGHRSYNIEWRAVTDGVILVVPPRVLSETVISNPELSALKVQHLISKEEASLEAMSANFTLPPALRLKVLLRQLIRAENRETEGWITVPYRLPAEVLGLVVNLTRANVSRNISEWIRQGLARRSGLDLEVHADLFADCHDWLERRRRHEVSA